MQKKCIHTQDAKKQTKKQADRVFNKHRMFKLKTFLSKYSSQIYLDRSVIFPIYAQIVRLIER